MTFKHSESYVFGLCALENTFYTTFSFFKGCLHDSKLGSLVGTLEKGRTDPKWGPKWQPAPALLVHPTAF